MKFSKHYQLSDEGTSAKCGILKTLFFPFQIWEIMYFVGDFGEGRTHVIDIS